MTNTFKLRASFARVCAVLFVAAVVSACSSSAGDAYVGTWQHSKSKDQILVIARVDGDQFRIDTTKPALWSGPRTPIQVSASMRDGALIPSGWSGGVAVLHVPETDTLSVQRQLGGTVVFNRIR